MTYSLRKLALAAGCMLFAGQLLATDEPKTPGVHRPGLTRRWF